MNSWCDTKLCPNGCDHPQPYIRDGVEFCSFCRIALISAAEYNAELNKVGLELIGMREKST